MMRPFSQKYRHILLPLKKNIDWWDMISDQEKKDIKKGLQQLKNGEGIPNEQVKRKVDKLFGRK